MTKHKIDDLFEQKLAGSAFTPSPAAWSKLESQLAQKKKKGIIFYMSIAASIALLLTFGWLVWRSQAQVSSTNTIALIDSNKAAITPIDSVKSHVPKASNEAEIAKSSTEIAIDPMDAVEPIKKKAVQPVDTKKPAQKKSTPMINIQRVNNLAQLNVVEETADNDTNEQQKPLQVTDEIPQDARETSAAITPKHQVVPPTKESGSIKLIYTLKPAISAARIAEQALTEEKKSPLKKAMAFAKNMKENPKGIGNLREAKNNLLSFNKKKNGSK
jgi:hypothetical protein